MNADRWKLGFMRRNVSGNVITWQIVTIVTMDETWIPMFNPETKWKSAQWKHTDSPPPKKFRVTASAEKMMVAMFWDKEGMILTRCIPKSTILMGET